MNILSIYQKTIYKQNITSITISASGGGDSGHIDDVVVEYDEVNHQEDFDDEINHGSAETILDGVSDFNYSDGVGGEVELIISFNNDKMGIDCTFSIDETISSKIERKVMDDVLEDKFSTHEVLETIYSVIEKIDPDHSKEEVFIFGYDGNLEGSSYTTQHDMDPDYLISDKDYEKLKELQVDIATEISEAVESLLDDEEKYYLSFNLFFSNEKGLYLDEISSAYREKDSREEFGFNEYSFKNGHDFMPTPREWFDYIADFDKKSVGLLFPDIDVISQYDAEFLTEDIEYKQAIGLIKTMELHPDFISQELITKIREKALSDKNDLEACLVAHFSCLYYPMKQSEMERWLEAKYYPVFVYHKTDNLMDLRGIITEDKLFDMPKKYKAYDSGFNAIWNLRLHELNIKQLAMYMGYNSINPSEVDEVISKAKTYADEVKKLTFKNDYEKNIAEKTSRWINKTSSELIDKLLTMSHEDCEAPNAIDFTSL